VELETRLDPDLGPVRADPTQIDQVILNLAVNARDAMPHGGRLTLETRNARVDTPLSSVGMAIDPGPYSVLEVSDTGTGMDAAVRERLFEPFFTTKEKGKGTGLGLATAYGIIRQTGGDIACESEPGRGTTFRIYLPRASQPAVSSHRAGDRGSRARTGAARTILLVEDEGGVRRLSRKLLESAGYAVLEASGADEALRILQNRPEPIHLLLTDVVMPGSNGPALARRLAGRRPEIRVLYMSGHTDAALEDLRPDATVIRKPFTAETLLSTVRSTLEDEATGNGTLGSAP
jgi:CheY-like chemotaxis protein